jgi:hypothetical protein
VTVGVYTKYLFSKQVSENGVQQSRMKRAFKLQN